MHSAGSCSPSSDNKKRPTGFVQSILGKRKYVDWTTPQPLNLDSRTNQNEQAGPFEYLIEWRDGLYTWEPVDNLLNVKDMLREFDDENAKKKREMDRTNKKFETLRKRQRKAMNKGNFEKNQIQEVIGMKKNKYDNQTVCKIRWKVEVQTDTRPSSVPQSQEALVDEDSTAIQEKIPTVTKAIFFQPDDTYVPISFLKQ